MRALLSDRDCEHLAVVMLDGRNEVIGAIVVATGGISNVVASVRDVFKGAIVGRASAILLGHNHPSGDVRPSPEDDLFTARVRAGADILGIPMLDHVIVSSGRGDAMFSYHAEGRL
jgi:DNA repair protein RadC